LGAETHIFELYGEKIMSSYIYSGKNMQLPATQLY